MNTVNNQNDMGRGTWTRKDVAGIAIWIIMVLFATGYLHAQSTNQYWHEEVKLWKRWFWTGGLGIPGIYRQSIWAERKDYALGRYNMFGAPAMMRSMNVDSACYGPFGITLTRDDGVALVFKPVVDRPYRNTEGSKVPNYCIQVASATYGGARFSTGADSYEPSFLDSGLTPEQHVDNVMRPVFMTLLKLYQHGFDFSRVVVDSAGNHHRRITLAGGKSILDSGQSLALPNTAGPRQWVLKDIGSIGPDELPLSEVARLALGDLSRGPTFVK